MVFIGALIYFWATRNKDTEEFIRTYARKAPKAPTKSEKTAKASK